MGSDPMLTIDMELLAGRVMAASYHDRKSIEWPPHPTRVYSAFVASYEENFRDEPEARNALEWLENLQPPYIYVNPPSPNVTGRDTPANYVPVNDKAQYKPEINKKSKKIKYQPPIFAGTILNRLRAERSFPAFTPKDPHVRFFYESPHSSHYIAELEKIAAQISYYGRSTTPVLVRVYESEGNPNLFPVKDGNIMLRVPGKGRLSHLEQIYEMRQKNMAIQPKVGQIVAYSVLDLEKTDETEVKQKTDMRFFRLSGDHAVPLSEAYLVTRFVRNAFMSLYPGQIPEAVSGHTPDGKPSDKDHMGVIPLPSAGYRYSDGHIMGFALVFHGNMSSEIRESVNYAMNHLQHITMGKYGVIRADPVSPLNWLPIPISLDSGTYTRSSRMWATVTPALFGKHPKRNQIGPGRNGGSVMEEACRMIGLPKPVEVRAGPASAVHGVPMTRDFYIPNKYRNYYMSHMIFRFDRDIEGPVIIGSGRFNGFGLCVPLKGGS
jgi:CRISPR-associated protein Csb2